jgi:hypothetical protein
LFFTKDENSYVFFLQAEVESLSMREQRLDDQIRLYGRFSCESNKCCYLETVELRLTLSSCCREMQDRLRGLSEDEKTKSKIFSCIIFCKEKKDSNGL